MKIYFIIETEKGIRIEVHDTKTDDYNKIIYEGEKVPDCLFKEHTLNVDVFYSEYDEKGDCYII